MRSRLPRAAAAAALGVIAGILTAYVLVALVRLDQPVPIVLIAVTVSTLVAVPLAVRAWRANV